MSKIIRGARKAIGGIVKGVGKVFKKVVGGIKKFAKSKIGKLIIMAAMIYFGGAALGYWNTPFASVNGALVKGTASQMAATGSTAATTGATATAGAGASQAAAGTALAPVGSVAPTVAGTAGAGAGASTVAGSAPWGGMSVDLGAYGGGFGAGKTSIIGSMMKGAGKFAKGVGGFAQEYPVAAAIGLNAAATAFSPDEIDILREKERLRQEALGNVNVDNIDIGVDPSGRPLTDSFGNPIYGRGGLINRGFRF